MRFKKILSAFLAAAITASSISVVSSAASPQIVEETVEKNYLATAFDDNFKYTQLYDETWEVSCPVKDIVKVVIPDTFNGKKVTRIAYAGFRNCSELTSLTIPSSVTYIDDRAFYGCTSLKSLNIPSGVTNIGSEAFSGCTSLTSMSIPSGVTDIAQSTFFGCSSLLSVTIPNSVKYLNSYAFIGCSGLKSITIPNSVKEIGAGAFADCKNLISITIPNSVTFIGGSAFQGCASLTSVTIPNSVKVIVNNTFEKCVSLKSITIPNSVTSIGEYAFSDCSSLESVTIPNSVTDIGKRAFYDCSSLRSITIPNNVKSINQYTFSGCTSLTAVTIPNSVTFFDIGAFFLCESLEDVYYTGPKAQWVGAVSFKTGNENLQNATIHYNYIPNVADLKATTTNKTVKLSWSENTEAAYYKVFIWKDSKWTQLTKTTSNETVAYTASSLTPNTSYKYRVTAYNSDNKVIAYSDITAKTAYGTITNLAAAPSNNGIKLTWTKDTTASYYKVFIWKDSKWTQLTQTGNNATVAYTASNLAANTSYKFRVTAYNSSDKAIAYSDITAKTYGNIANLKAAPTDSTVKLTWSKNTSASYYKVFIWKNSKWTQLTKTTSNATVAYTASKLTPNTSYKFRVTAYNSSDKAIAYSDITAKTNYGTISNLKAVPTAYNVKLTWNQDTSASYYKVFIWKDSKWTQLTQTTSNATLAYTASKLTPNTSYKFRVTAYNSSGKAIAYSDITSKTKYGTISNLKAAPAKNSVKLTWTKNASASCYKVFIWKDSKWTQLTQTTSNATVAYTASKLTANTSYKFRVTAYTGSGKAIAYSDITAKTTA